MDLAAIKAAAAAAPTLEVGPAPVDETRDLHVDGDYAAYYFSGNDETTISSAKRNLIDTIKTVALIAGVGGRVIVHLSGGLSDKGKRFKIATVKDYQGQRDSSRRPKNWEALRTWLEQSKTLPGTDFRVVTWDDREADDGVAAAARYAWESGRVPAIFSRDKDFQMIPGMHVSWTTFSRLLLRPETFEQKDEDGRTFGQKWFWMQMIQGDTADNIPGLEKQRAKSGGWKTCGEACAEVNLFEARNSDDAFGVVRGMYQDYYGGSWADRFAEQAALLWLRTDNDAYVGDFMRAVPMRDKELEQAVVRLQKRIA